MYDTQAFKAVMRIVAVYKKLNKLKEMLEYCEIGLKCTSITMHYFGDDSESR